MHTETQTINGYRVVFTIVEGPDNPRHEQQNGLILTKPNRHYNEVDGKMPETFECAACEGTGEVRPEGEDQTCTACEGEGEVPATWATLVEWAKREHGATTVIALSGPHDDERYRPMDVDAPNMDRIGGIIFDTAERRGETGTRPIQMDSALRAEVDEYNAWADGDVWEYAITDRNGDRVDEAGLNDMSNAIIGWENAVSEATMEAEHAGPQPAELFTVRLTAAQWAMILDELPGWTRFVEYRETWQPIRAAIEAAAGS